MTQEMLDNQMRKTFTMQEPGRMDDPLWRDGRPWLFLKKENQIQKSISDVVHQSVYELVHSEDREELQRQLTWSSQLAADSGLTLLDALRPDNSMILERSFTVRFRCLLDNTSGFLAMIAIGSSSL
ncbi:hypothetical protein OUZ56_014807 [Daphnia magna]|uniref:PAS domain-containing protein n=1 Tax=Daphnia magna TaxID=35525 RepID=A0ABR0AKX0_9CRUS|nr:hypothetical protein OUZ56_014807 [Daphnia magna]